jgi:hypothetical protein
MDDVEAVIEQATDAMGSPPEAPAEAPKPEMKKARQAAKKVARKVEPKKKVGKKAEKSAKKSAKKEPKKAKEGNESEALRSNENLRTKVGRFFAFVSWKAGAHFGESDFLRAGQARPCPP